MDDKAAAIVKAEVTFLAAPRRGEGGEFMFGTEIPKHISTARTV